MAKTEARISLCQKCRLKWAALIKAVYEVDLLRCPKCGGTIKTITISFIEDDATIQSILKHCGKWKEAKKAEATGCGQTEVGRLH